jgi:undecaprenyl-diphosphatase
MVDWLQVVILALIQGVTEFLPVSSSAHLLLPSKLLGWPDQGLAFDISVHAGTLCAVVFYFRQTLFGLARALMPGSGLDRSECWTLLIATLPVLLAGFLLKELIAGEARTVVVITTTTLLFGVLLGCADWVSRRGQRRHTAIRARDAFLIGCAQTLALIPGTSRSGITITAALFLGYHPTVAARFSFLLSVPVIAGAVVVMLMSDHVSLSAHAGAYYVIAFLVSGCFAYATISAFIYWVSKIGLMPFVVYRLLLGFALWIGIVEGL